MPVISPVEKFTIHLVGTNNGLNQYKITVRLFRECDPPPGSQPTAQLPSSVNIGIFRATSPVTVINNNIVAPVTGGSSGIYDILSLQSINPCITNAPAVCYQVAYYSVTVDLPNSPEDYIIAFETCCRTNGISNIGGSAVGATYTANIPGTNTIANMKNHSAVFNLKDTTLICKYSNFTLDFSASDADGDSLVYTFCDAYTATTATNSAPIPASNPPYFSIPYASGYSGGSPLGSTASINSTTGIISGVSPGPGSYVLNVCVSEYRAGKLITVHRKDFTLKIGDCELTGAKLKPSYINCDSSTVHFQNESQSSNISSYFWDFGVNYILLQILLQNQHQFIFILIQEHIHDQIICTEHSVGCKDSATAQVLVYPGFVPDFAVTGSCFLNSYQFTDLTKSKYGVVNKWRWDFGDVSTTADTSIIKNPVYKYPSSGIRNIQFIVSDTKRL
jgi:hypothetical protein